MGKIPTRDEAWELLCEYTKTPALRTHALTVESVMRYFAAQKGGDVELWGVVGLLHDLDYEQFPAEHCHKIVDILQSRGIDETIIHAAQSHGFGLCCDVAPDNEMEKTLYATDELTGLIHATCLMRPSKSVLDCELKSVKKKFKDQSFAAGVNRDVVRKGCEMLGAELDDIITGTIMGMRENAEALGLKGSI